MYLYNGLTRFELLIFSADSYIIRLLSIKGDYLTSNGTEKYVYPSTQLSKNNLWIMKHNVGNDYTLQNLATRQFLHRPDVKINEFPGTDTTSSISVYNIWELEALSGQILHNTTIQLKSWHSDYLHRGNNDLITTWGNGEGNKWTMKIVKGKIVNICSYTKKSLNFLSLLFATFVMWFSDLTFSFILHEVLVHC